MRKSQTSEAFISESYYDSLYNLLQNYRDSESNDNNTTKQQLAVITLLTDFMEV